VATSLPSSYSQTLDGQASTEDVREVLRWLLAVGARSSSDGEPTDALDGAGEATLGGFLSRDSPMAWEVFRTAMAGPVVR